MANTILASSVALAAAVTRQMSITMPQAVAFLCCATCMLVTLYFLIQAGFNVVIVRCSRRRTPLWRHCSVCSVVCAQCGRCATSRTFL